MPTYEYRCNACHREFEVQKRMSDPLAQDCLWCGSSDTQRLISHSSFVLKGTGWYVTDYARKNGSGGSSAGHGKGNGKSSSSAASGADVTSTPAAPSGDGASQSSATSGASGSSPSA